MLEDKSLVPASSMGIPEEPTQLQSTLWDCLKPLLLPHDSYLLFSPILPLLPCSCFFKRAVFDRPLTCKGYMFLVMGSHISLIFCSLFLLLLFSLLFSWVIFYSPVSSSKLIFSAVQFSTINIQKVLNFRYCMLQFRNVHLILFYKIWFYLKNFTSFLYFSSFWLACWL